MVVPLGVGAALYMEEYGNRESRLNRLIEVNIQNLAAVPAIVYGILGLAFIVRGPISLGFMLFAGSITLTLLVLPTVIIAAREAIRAVPPSIREGSLALGATQWQTIRHQVLPAALPGILTGVILAVSRALGEAAPLLLFGAAVFVTTDPQPFNPTLAGPRSRCRSSTSPRIPRRNCASSQRPESSSCSWSCCPDELLRDLATQSIRTEVVGDLQCLSR